MADEEHALQAPDQAVARKRALNLLKEVFAARKANGGIVANKAACCGLGVSDSRGSSHRVSRQSCPNMHTAPSVFIGPAGSGPAGGAGFSYARLLRGAPEEDMEVSRSACSMPRLPHLAQGGGAGCSPRGSGTLPVASSGLSFTGPARSSASATSSGMSSLLQQRPSSVSLLPAESTTPGEHSVTSLATQLRAQLWASEGAGSAGAGAASSLLAEPTSVMPLAASRPASFTTMSSQQQQQQVLRAQHGPFAEYALVNDGSDSDSASPLVLRGPATATGRLLGGSAVATAWSEGAAGSGLISARDPAGSEHTSSSSGGGGGGSGTLLPGAGSSGTKARPNTRFCSSSLAPLEVGVGDMDFAVELGTAQNKPLAYRTSFASVPTEVLSPSSAGGTPAGDSPTTPVRSVGGCWDAVSPTSTLATAFFAAPQPPSTPKSGAARLKDRSVALVDVLDSYLAGEEQTARLARKMQSEAGVGLLLEVEGSSSIPKADSALRALREAKEKDDPIPLLVAGRTNSSTAALRPSMAGMMTQDDWRGVPKSTPRSSSRAVGKGREQATAHQVSEVDKGRLRRIIMKEQGAKKGVPLLTTTQVQARGS